MQTILFFTLLAWAGPVWAAASPYETIREIYFKATTPATIEDFDLNTNIGSNQECVGAEPHSTRPYPVYVLRYNVFVPGEPGHGPLFPGTPDHMESIVLINAQSRNHMDQWAESIFRNVFIETRGRDLIISIDSREYVDRPLILRARKSGDLLPIQVTAFAGTTRETIAYVYCYRNP